MLTTKQSLVRVGGAYLSGFLIVMGATTPFDLDFGTNIIKAAWGGMLMSLFQLKYWADSYGKTKRQQS